MEAVGERVSSHDVILHALLNLETRDYKKKGLTDTQKGGKTKETRQGENPGHLAREINNKEEGENLSKARKEHGVVCVSKR